MDISSVKFSLDVSSSLNAAQTTSRMQTEAAVSTANTNDGTVKAVTAPSDDKINQTREPSLQEVTQMTEAMNKFVQAMDANIRFKIHEKTNELMVQVVDQTNNKVLKEFPSPKFLDTMAAIRDYVGILLDKKI